ncbi:MAG: sugar nucleotide-binding protein [Planctomycetota bacterium]|nr:sugar nucleotide-binding protein [Planctomycetota bacterium]
MKILIVGKGHLGTYLTKGLDVPGWDVIWHQGMMEELTVAALRAIGPFVIVNTAAKTDIDWCEQHPHEAWRNNVVEPLRLFKRSQNVLPMRGIYIHISSGCIWDGPYDENGKAFEPNDFPQPACFYTWTKAACDALLLQEAKNTNLAIIRFRQLYSSLPGFGRNILMKLMGYEKLHDNPNSMCSAETVLHTIFVITEFKFSLPRIINVYETGVLSPYAVAQKLAAASLRQSPVLATKGDLDKEPRTRRVDTVLRDDAFERIVKPIDVGTMVEKNIRLLKMELKLAAEQPKKA